MTSKGAEGGSQHWIGRNLQLPRWLLWAVLFAAAYGQSPLYTSNQNQYFLHPLARAGYGQLASDWLANTVDPTPVFTALSLLTLRSLGPLAFYLEYGLLLAVYFLSLRSILFTTWDLDSSRLRRQLTNLTLLVIHSAAFRLLLGRLLGPDGAFLLEGGLAGQRLLGNVYQPSSFGVLLVASLALFLRQRPYAAAIAAASAAALHPTYLLSAGALTAGYLWSLVVRERDYRLAVTVGVLALGLVAPTLVTTYRVFQPTSPGLARQAAEILVSFRLPHHAVPQEWFGGFSAIKILLIGLALALSYRPRVNPILTLTAAISLLLSAVAIVADNPRLALLFPWRPTALLVPLSTALIVGRLIRFRTRSGASESPRQPPIVALGMGALVGALALAGLARTVLLAGDKQSSPAAELYRQVESNLQPGQVYLVPPKMQEFRLETGAPIFVDFKAIPYRDTEIIEWEERVQLARFFYRDDPALISCDLLPRIYRHEAISHVILEVDQFGLHCPGLQPVHSSGEYAILHFRPAAD